MDIDALAALAANTIVATAVTDAFEGLRAKVARVFGRDKADPGIERESFGRCSRSTRPGFPARAGT